MDCESVKASLRPLEPGDLAGGVIDDAAGSGHWGQPPHLEPFHVDAERLQPVPRQE